jgi:hypothetical protein
MTRPLSVKPCQSANWTFGRRGVIAGCHLTNTSTGGRCPCFRVKTRWAADSAVACVDQIEGFC